MPAPGEPRLASPFSNSTDGDAWTEYWCDGCVHDKGARTGEDPSGCPLRLIALVGETPAEWKEKDPASMVNRYECTRFVQDPDEVPRKVDGSRFYVTARKPDGTKTVPLLGPYTTLEDAERNEARARRHAVSTFPDAGFALYGVTETAQSVTRKGVFNDAIGLEERQPAD
jgi:hypothetical protein